MKEIITAYVGKNLVEIEEELKKKNIEELIDIFNNVSEVKFTIHKNDWYNIDNIVPEDMRVETGFNSAKEETYFDNDEYVYYVDLQLYSFSELSDDYCPLSLKMLAKYVYMFCLKFK